MSNKVNTDKIRKISNEIDLYENSTPKPDNQLGWPDYIKPILTKYKAMKTIVDRHVATYNEDMRMHGNQDESSNNNNNNNGPYTGPLVRSFPNPLPHKANNNNDFSSEPMIRSFHNPLARPGGSRKHKKRTRRQKRRV